MPLPELIHDLEEALLGGIQSEFHKTRRVLDVLDRHKASPTNKHDEDFMAALDDLHANLTKLAGNVGALIDKNKAEGTDNGAKAELDAQNATLAQFAAGVAGINTQVEDALNPTPAAGPNLADPAPATDAPVADPAAAPAGVLA